MNRKPSALALTIATLAFGAASATDFYWTGNDGSDNAWSTPGNWGNPCESTDAGAFEFTKADSTTIYLKTATVKPGTADNAYFENSATISLTAGENVNNSHFNADVTFTSSSKNYLNLTQDTHGAGKLTLDGSVYLRAASKSIKIQNPLEIASQNAAITPNDGKIVTVSGALTGAGTLTCNENSGTGSVRFTGDTSAFTGTVKIAPSTTSVHYSNISNTAAADNTLSSWEIYPDTKYAPSADNAGVFPFRINGGTFKFGSLVANVPALKTAADCKNITLELGAKDAGSYLGGDFASSTGAKVVWVGQDSIFTNACAGIATLEVTKANATVYLSSAAGIPSAIDFKEAGGKIIATYSAKAALATALGASTVQPTIQYDIAELAEDDTLDASNLAPGCTIQITAANITKAGDTLVTVSSGTIPADATYTVLSKNTGEESKFYTAESNSEGTAIVAAYKSGVYVWNASSGSTVDNKGSWLVADGSGGLSDANTAPAAASLLLFPADGSGETLEFKASSKDNRHGSFYFGRDATMTSGRLLCYYGSSTTSYTNVVEGVGKLTFQTGTALLTGQATTIVYCDVEAQGTFTTSSQNNRELRYCGKFSGEGNVTVNNNKQSSLGIVRFCGDMSEYSGTMTTDFNSGYSSYLQFDEAATNIAGSVVLGENGNLTSLCGSAGTYTFGSLSGKVKGPSALGDVTIVTGSAQTEAKTINFVAATSSPTPCSIKNVGEYDIAVTGNNFSSYIVSGTGAFKLLSTLVQSATVTKVGSAANAKKPALVIEEANVDLTGLNLALEVPDEVSGWQYLVQATSFSGDATTLPTYAKPEGRDKYNLKMKSDTILGATDATGFTIIIVEGDPETEINDGNLETWLMTEGYTISDADIGTKVMTQANGIAPLEAYLLGYDSATPTPTLGAEIAGDTITFNFAGTTPRSINGLGVSYEIESRNSTTADWSANENDTPTETGATLTFANAGLYNRLVAKIVAAD